MFVIFALLWVPGIFADEHLIFYANFDEDLGDKVKDLSPYENDGEFLGGAEWSPDGKIAGCAAIRGEGANVTIPEIDAYNIEEVITMEAWVNPDKIPQEPQGGVIFFKAGNYAFWFVTSGQLRLADQGGNRIDTAGFPFEAEEWYHIAGILDTETPQRQIYINGELEAEDKIAFSLTPTPGPLMIGREPAWAQYNGLVDEAVVWNVVRTEDEIKQDMEGLSSAVLPVDKLAVTWGQLRADGI
jgi:hypothetical protein